MKLSKDWKRALCCLVLLLVPFLLARPQESDKKVVTATFKVVYSQGGKALVQPVLPVYFQITRTTGDPSKPIPVEFITCDVFRRAVAVEEKNKRELTVTILKCGNEEYGIQGVLFSKE